MSLQLNVATKTNVKLRLALLGLAGAGKTYSALSIATHLVPGGVIMVLDSEHGRARLYADKFKFSHFDVDNFDPRNYIRLIKEAAALGVDVLILDSMSHAWQALLEIAEKEKGQGGKPFGGWDKATPIHRQFIDTILGCDMHVIATMRQKSDYSIETNDRGKASPKKIGLKAEQKSDVDYEFDIVGELDRDDHTMRITKTRCADLDGKQFYRPGEEFANSVKAWLDSGVKPESKPASDKLAAEPAVRTVTAEEVGKYAADAAVVAKGWDLSKLTLLAKARYNKAPLTKLSVPEFAAMIKYCKSSAPGPGVSDGSN